MDHRNHPREPINKIWEGEGVGKITNNENFMVIKLAVAHFNDALLSWHRTTVCNRIASTHARITYRCITERDIEYHLQKDEIA